MKLTDAKIRTLPNPGGKSRKLADGHGLMLLIAPTGLKSWYLRKKINDKEQMIFIGRYPGVGLAEARKMASDITARIAQGMPPKEEKKKIVTSGEPLRNGLKSMRKKQSLQTGRPLSKDCKSTFFPDLARWI